VRIAPDETRRPVIDAVGRLLAEGVSWRRIEPEIFARFGYGSPTGKTWYPLKFYYILSSPQFWGHSARFSYAEHRAFSLWVMEEGHTIPDGVLMFYNTHEAFWRGAAFATPIAFQGYSSAAAAVAV
jgi:hypothetical protein